MPTRYMTGADKTYPQEQRLFDGPATRRTSRAEQAYPIIKLFMYVSAAVVVVAMVYFFFFAAAYVDGQYNTVEENSSPYTASMRAQGLHGRMLIADLHTDLLLWNRDPLQRARRGHSDIPRLQEGGVGLQVFSAIVKTPRKQNYTRNRADTDVITPLVIAQRWPMRTWFSLKERALYQAEKLHAVAERSLGKLTVLHNTRELQQFAQRRFDTDTIGGLLSIEGLHALEGDIANIDVFFEAGFRMMGLVHFFDNDIAGSSSGLVGGGLTRFGREVIRRLEARQIIIDLAHASPQTVDDVLTIATRPVVVSHTGVRGTCDIPRNLSDRHIRAVASNGGLIGIGFWEQAICSIEPAAIVQTIRYVINLAGIDHVALGSDFDGGTHTKFDATGLVQITEALLAAGFTDADIAKIMGGNVMRFLRENLPN